MTFALLLASLFMLSACIVNGGIVINHRDNPDGYDITLKDFNSTDTCKMTLQEGDVIQIEVVRQRGKMGLIVQGKLGSEPYNGSTLETRTFTITIPNNDEYTFSITGANASGSIKIKVVS